MNKKLFYQKMQPYFEQNMVREIYSSDDVCILSFGEICYVACPYTLINDEPVGLYTNKKVMMEVVQNNRYIYPLMKKIFSDINKYQSLFYNFPIKKMDIWKNWIKENRDKNISDIDYHFEEKIAQMSKNKSR